ncbi:hypothetical protein SEA_CARON_29 [Microbacterium phage Caron]|uniref:Uncharacterized protein n=1 Tax=Microbacterium phage Caron TaxID=3028494 RepID=A0AAF0CJJ0_9CAUD|nr:hypothetical protein SEA_CARON_29 [Microbacterium phage Caron]
MNIRTAFLGLRPYLLVEQTTEGHDFELSGVTSTAEARALLRKAEQGIRIARRQLRQRARQERKLARLEKRTLRDFDTDRAGASSSLEVAE